jgi:hypothetical protein
MVIVATYGFERRLGNLAKVVEQNASDVFLLESEGEKLKTEWLTLKDIIANEI